MLFVASANAQKAPDSRICATHISGSAAGGDPPGLLEEDSNNLETGVLASGRTFCPDMP